MELSVKIAIVQLDIVWEDPKQNMSLIERLLDAENLDGVDILLFPEMFSSGFTMNPERVATPREGRTVSWMREIARHYGMQVLGSHAETEGSDFWNTAVLADRDGTIAGTYRKIHPFGQERDHYREGDSLFVFQLGPFTATVFICYDLRFPEIFRAAVTRGVNLFFICANWPAARGHHWEILLRARAIENQAFVCACNRTGRDPDILYNGGSCAVLPDGAFGLQMGESQGVKKVELSFEDLNRARTNFCSLDDRRPGIYRGL